MSRSRLDVPLKIKSINDHGEFSGYGSVFGVKDSYDDIVVKGAFEQSLQEKKPALLWQHKSDEPIGIWTKAEEDENGLYVEGKLLVDDDELARRAYAHLKAGSITGLSIGYALNDYDYDNEKEAFILKEIDLWEISLVTFPANEEARISDVKNSLALGKSPKAKTVERLLRDAGFSRQQAKTFMSKGYSGITCRDDEDIAEAISKLNSIIKR